MDSPSLSGKRKVSLISPNGVKFSPEEKRTREEEFGYLEAYSRRENLKFAGIQENIPEGQQTENTKELVYEFLLKVDRCHEA